MWIWIGVALAIFSLHIHTSSLPAAPKLNGKACECVITIPPSVPAPADNRGATEQSRIFVEPVESADAKHEAREKSAADDRRESARQRLDNLTLCVLTLQLVVFAFQTFALFRQAKLLQATVQDTRQATVLAQRPKLRVRNIIVKQPTPVHASALELFAPQQFVSGQLYVSNIGGTPATITGIGCWIEWTNQFSLPMERPYEGRSPNVPLEGKTLHAGEPMTVPFQSEKLMSQDGPSIRTATGFWKLYVMGRVEYRDAIGTQRRTTFCRQWRAPEKHFSAVDNPDYENED